MRLIRLGVTGVAPPNAASSRLLLLFGGALVTGLLAPLQWIDVVAALVILLIVRPVTGLIGLIGLKSAFEEKLTLAFFGIRGVGSIYYLAYGLHVEILGHRRPAASGGSPSLPGTDRCR